MKNLNLIIALLLFGTIVSCSGETDYEDFDETYEMTYDINLDNGLDTTVIVNLTLEGSDSIMVYEVEGYGLENIELKEGKYHITAKTVTDSSFLDEDFELNSGYSYNLNLTKEDYILERVTYVDNRYPETYTNQSVFTYKGKTYDEIDATVIEGALLVENTWDFNLEDELPEEVTLMENMTRTTRTKLYRSTSFIAILELYDMLQNMDFEGLLDEEEEY